MSFARAVAAANHTVARVMGTPVLLPRGETVLGVFGQGTDALDSGAGLDLLAPVPWVVIASRASAYLVREDEVHIEDRLYTIREVIPDTFGMTRFTLRRSAGG